MRTTITIDCALLEELVEMTGEKSKSAALSTAAEEYVRSKKLRDLKDFWLGIRVDNFRDENKEVDLRRFLDLNALRKQDGIS
jgi:Arc/MetJ family transcription regulator